MLIYSTSVSVDGFIADREGGIGWTVPDDEPFAFHLERVRELGCHLCGRKLYETMLVWETDLSLRDSELHAEFAEVWFALPKIVFSRTLDGVHGNARLAEGSVGEEIAAALAATDRDVEIGGAGLAASAVELDLVDELRMFRNPIVLGAGTAIPTAGHGERPTGIDRDQDVRLARGLRALPARPWRLGVTANVGTRLASPDLTAAMIELGKPSRHCH